MTQQSWTIGSDSQCDIIVNSNMVSSRHARLTQDGTELTLADLGSTNGTFVNGQRLHGSQTVSTEDQITLGQSQAMPWPESLKPQVDKQQNATESSAKEKPQRIVTLGRGSDNTVVLQETNVSTHHARLITEGGEMFLEDLGSTNGTSLGKVANKISRASVSPDDTIFLGSTAYQVSDLINRSKQTHVVAKPDSKQTHPAQSAKGMPVAIAASAVLAVILGLLGWLALRDRSPVTTQVASVLESPPVVSITPIDRSSEEPIQPAVPEPVKADVPAEPADAALSVQDRLQQSLFVIVCADPQRKTPFRVGTGFAIDAEHVATSASVVEAMKGLQDNGFPEVFLFSPDSENEYSVVSTTCHPEFESANAVARTAQREHDQIFDELEAKPPTPEAFENVKDELVAARSKALEAMDRKTSFDVAIIKVGRPLVTWLSVSDSVSSLRPNLRIEVTGYAFDVQDPYFDPVSPQEVSTMKSRVGQVVQDKSGSTARMIAKGSIEQLEYAYLGSPVIDTQGQLIGVYSRPSPLAPDTEPDADAIFDVALAKNLRRCFPER